jgi:hypothetical protein
MLSCLSMKRSRMARRGFSVTLQAAACLLLAIIAADLVGDTGCDSFGLGAASPTTVRAAAKDGANEACADVCVPDCFCCSRSVAAAPLVLPPEPQRLTSVEAPVSERWSEGIRPVVDHPPLARA